MMYRPDGCCRCDGIPKESLKYLTFLHLLGMLKITGQVVCLRSLCIPRLCTVCHMIHTWIGFSGYVSSLNLNQHCTCDQLCDLMYGRVLLEMALTCFVVFHRSYITLVAKTAQEERAEKSHADDISALFSLLLSDLGRVLPYLGMVGRFRGDDPHVWDFLSNWVPILCLIKMWLTPSFYRKNLILGPKVGLICSSKCISEQFLSILYQFSPWCSFQFTPFFIDLRSFWHLIFIKPYNRLSPFLYHVLNLFTENLVKYPPPPLSENYFTCREIA